MEQTKIKLKAHPVEISFREEIEIVEKRTMYVMVEGEEFECNNLLEALSEVEEGDTIIINKRMCTHLKKIEVLKSCGNKRWYEGATKGSRFKSLYKQLAIKIYGEE